MLSLEKVHLITKQDILNVYADLFECASESSLSSLFDMMERNMFVNGLLSADKEDQMNNLLNMCSKICKIIMRKLSVTHDIGFRGKVQKLIAAVFPMTHPSGK